MKTFSDKVRDVVRKISKGHTMTYKEVATRAGNPNAARAVGAVMRTNFDPDIPCHRVIKSDGSLGSYNRGGAQKKKAILKAEVVQRCEKFFSEDGATPAHRCIVAHNAPFDRKFLHALWGQVGKEFPANLWLDTTSL